MHAAVHIRRTLHVAIEPGPGRRARRTAGSAVIAPEVHLSPEVPHKHRCSACGFVWEHAEVSPCDMSAHDCPSCGTEERGVLIDHREPTPRDVHDNFYPPRISFHGTGADGADTMPEADIVVQRLRAPEQYPKVLKARRSLAPARGGDDQRTMIKRTRNQDGADNSSEDSPTFYFGVISERKLLTKTEEIELAKKLEGVEIDAWRHLLESPIAERVRAIVTTENLRELAVYRERSNLVEIKWSGALSSVAAAKRDSKVVRAVDLDRQYIDAVLRKLGDKIPVSVAELYREAMRIRDIMIGANLRLVVSIAKNFLYSGMPLVDLIQEGNLGLMHAVPRYDHRRGLRFSTFAVWWIRHTISRGVSDTSRAVRVPVHMLDASSKLFRHNARLTRELGRSPSDDELAASVGIDKDKIEQLRSTSLMIVGHAISLDSPLSPDDPDSNSVIDTFIDNRTEDLTVSEQVIQTAEHKRLHKLIAQLPAVDAEILRQRFGIGRDELTLQEIGDIRGLSRERIRQLERSAIHKLRAMMRSS